MVLASCADALDAIRPIKAMAAPRFLVMISSGIAQSRPRLHYVVARFCSRHSLRLA
jgi:hypothetical protein